MGAGERNKIKKKNRERTGGGRWDRIKEREEGIGSRTKEREKGCLTRKKEIDEEHKVGSINLRIEIEGGRIKVERK